MREVHGGLLRSKQFIQGFIADSYMDIQAARLADGPDEVHRILVAKNVLARYDAGTGIDFAA